MYHYETLGDERFQHFCQALIVSQFPQAQCLPVGQPDGGRDAYWIRHLLANSSASNHAELIVFQVKYAKKDALTRDAREMIKSVIQSEKPKIDKLIKSGLKQYYLLTNVAGTSHIGSGSIDQLNKILSDELGIEAYCWWRDDLDRRLDANANIKWSYPEILKASDLLQTLVAGLIGEDEERRRNAVRAYMVAQYADDQELKFKQTDLRSTMSDLFVDLPMRRSTDLDQIDEASQIKFARLGHIRSSFHFHRTYLNLDDDSVLAASFLSTLSSDNDLNRIVLEGAPGQGKSTITQFMCQIMRMHLLDRKAELAKLPEHFRRIPLRIPFRVDLRDLAKWIAGIDPFRAKDVPLDDREPKSLEGFLAAQVRVTSGGHDFSVSDLTAIAKASHLLLALDGFDEVADVTLRQQLVNEITKGCGRLTSAGDFTLRTIVTSRPAAFAKSIRFPRDQWSYFELLPLGRQQVDDYTGKWMRAKGIKEVEQSQLVKILDVKLLEQHTQFLAKNPMQLTILLSLIHNRGASLPEKRTAMYDAYMDMFFSRESEKSAVVRDHRDLLIDIHRYLAWKLQTSAEGGGNGSFEQTELRNILLIYLDQEGENTSIVSDLFNGIIERVGALVSRVQGTFEFEVQPLREYFAARHLYETAPYSPAGDEKNGTKLERFDALIRNPYWLNVARFYGGCFSKGEISALVDELHELCHDPDFGPTSHPRSIALMLLGDWVFTQYQPAVRRVISILCEQPQLRQLLANSDDASGTNWTLPERSGRVDFVEALWARTVGTVPADEKRALATAIYQNTAQSERNQRWLNSGEDMPPEKWIELGSLLRIFREADEDFIEGIFEYPSDELISAVLEDGRFDIIRRLGFSSKAAEVMLNKLPFSGMKFSIKENSAESLYVLYSICGYYQYRMAVTADDSISMRDYVTRRFGRNLLFPHGNSLSDLSKAQQEAVRNHDLFLDSPATELSTSIAPWSKLVRSLQKAWGDCPAFDRIAFIAAGVRAKSVAGHDCRLEDADDLVLAARFIRLKSGAPRWWHVRLGEEKDSKELFRLLLLLLTWGTSRTIFLIREVIAETLEKLTDDDWCALCKNHEAIGEIRKSEDLIRLNAAGLAEVMSGGTRLATFIGLRADTRSQFAIAQAMGGHGVHLSKAEIQFCMNAVQGMCRRHGEWQNALPDIKRLYSQGGNFLGSLRGSENSFNLALARTISDDLSSFPLSLLALADNQLRSAAGSAAAKLNDIATSDHWFRTE